MQIRDKKAGHEEQIEDSCNKWCTVGHKLHEDRTDLLKKIGVDRIFWKSREEMCKRNDRICWKSREIIGILDRSCWKNRNIKGILDST